MAWDHWPEVAIWTGLSKAVRGHSKVQRARVITSLATKIWDHETHNSWMYAMKLIKLFDIKILRAQGC